jgi:hypothetical protein
MIPLALGLATAAVIVTSLSSLPKKTTKALERAYYKTTWRDLGTTQETPAVTMKELVYGPKDDS